MEKIKTLKVRLHRNTYCIHIGMNLLDNITAFIPNVTKFSKVVLITDKIVSENLKQQIKRIESSFAQQVLNFVVPEGEKTKSFYYLEKLIEKILKEKIDRNSLIICFGGGVIGDLSGLISSLLLRGIEFVQVPTTLLAQVDSSVGGKTSINSKFGKNLIGTFNQPISVIISIDTLKTLKMRQIKSGYAEILKYSLIKNRMFYLWLKKNGGKVLSLEQEAIIHAINESCSVKSEIVSIDEKESGIREILNFGHTFGHALELKSGFSKKINHGEAIFIGMFLALKFSFFLGFCEYELVQSYSDHLKSLGIKFKLKDYNISIKADKFIELLKYDKKVKDSRIRFILLKELGKPFSYTLDNEKVISDFFKEYLE